VQQENADETAPEQRRQRRAEAAANTFAGATVHAIVLEIHDDDAWLPSDGEIAVWSTTKQATDLGVCWQISRAGRPVAKVVPLADSVQRNGRGSLRGQLTRPVTLADGSQATSALLLPYMSRAGQHGFKNPQPGKPFDMDQFLANLIGRWFETRGRELHFEPCQAKEPPDCAWIPAPPP